jgi:proteasome lid subunit RPN8/RPN11
VPTRNVADDPERRYRVDPADHLRCIREGRRRGLEVIGVYHSHPRSGAQPSATDRDEGFGGFVFLIVGLGAEVPEVAGWVWAEGNFAPFPLVRSSKG